MYLEVSASSLAFSSKSAAGLLDLLVLAFDFHVLLGELLGFLRQLLVGLLQLLLLGLQLGGELLRLLQQRLGLHGGFNAVEHDADAGGELIEEGQMRGGEGAERGQFDHGFHAALEEHRKHDDVSRNGPEEAGANGNGVLGQFRDQHAALLEGALANEALPESESLRVSILAIIGERREQPHAGGLFRLDLIDHALLSGHQGSQFRKKHAADGGQVALAL